jgi:hypothetical protein
MAFSPFDRRLLDEGLDWFEQPRLTGLLELLGTGRLDRVDVLVGMLRRATDEEFEEALAIFDRAVTRAEREREGRRRNGRVRRARDREAREGRRSA